MAVAGEGGEGGANRRLVVIGSGAAGLTAALAAAQAAPALEVLVLEKNNQVGGNSAKASSGINAVTPEQGDSEGLYVADTLKSGGGRSRSDLVDALASSSRSALDLLTSLGLDLSVVVRLGGHSAPRTHSNPTGPNVGFAIVRALEGAVRQQRSVRIVTGARVTSIAYSGDGRLAVEYEATPQPPTPGASGSTAAAAAAAAPDRVTVMADGLVLATGGFAASRELLARHCPAAADLATTNGPWATGDGLALGGGLGAALVGLEDVQVHPTGFVDKADPGAGTKFLAPEKLRGCGAVLINGGGHRFVDELSTRDVVAAALLALPHRTAWLLLGHEGAEAFGAATLRFYEAKGLVTKVANASDAAAVMEVPPDALASTLTDYNAHVSAGGGDPLGKRHFPSKIDPSGPLVVAKVTPVVHYTMGGLSVGSDAAVLRADDGKPLRHVWAAGEATGGLHGANRLGGNSLAECVVFGRIAGASAAQALAGETLAPSHARSTTAHTPLLIPSQM